MDQSLNVNLLTKFVLVDDNFADLQIMEFALHQLFPKAQIHSFQSGEDLFNYLQTFEGLIEDIDAFFVDYNMPGCMPPHEILRQLQSYTKKEIPVYVFSGAISKTFKEEMIQLGAKDFLEKPTNFIQLLALIEGLFKTKPTLSKRIS